MHRGRRSSPPSCFRRSSSSRLAAQQADAWHPQQHMCSSHHSRSGCSLLAVACRSARLVAHLGSSSSTCISTSLPVEATVAGRQGHQRRCRRSTARRLPGGCCACPGMPRRMPSRCAPLVFCLPTISFLALQAQPSGAAQATRPASCRATTAAATAAAAAATGSIAGSRRAACSRLQLCTGAADAGGGAAAHAGAGAAAAAAALAPGSSRRQRFASRDH